MRRVSKKQAQRNRKLAKIKSEIDRNCCICGRHGYQLMHLLPRSLYPEHYTRKENLAIGCQECHEAYDNNVEFRKEQRHLYERICKFDKKGANKYFQVYDTL